MLSIKSNFVKILHCTCIFKAVKDSATTLDMLVNLSGLEILWTKL